MIQETPNGKPDEGKQPIVPLSQRPAPAVVMRLELRRIPGTTQVERTSWQVVVPATDYHESDELNNEFLAAAYDIATTLKRAVAVDYAAEMRGPRRDGDK